MKRLTGLVAQLIPNYFVEIYGSHATELCLHWSDIDLVVGQISLDNESFKMQDVRIKDSLRKISDCLRGEISNNWVTEVLYLD